MNRAGIVFGAFGALGIVAGICMIAVEHDWSGLIGIFSGGACIGFAANEMRQ